MNTIQFDIGDDYDTKCGEMFLTLKGNIVFHCTLCEYKYEVFEHYADHILMHYIKKSNIKQEIANEVRPAQLNDDDRVLLPSKRRKKKPPPLSELMTKLFELDNTTNLSNKEEPEATIKEEPIDHDITEEEQLMSHTASQSNYDAGNSEAFNIKVEFCETDFFDNETVDTEELIEKQNFNVKCIYECSHCNEVFSTSKSLQDHQDQEQHHQQHISSDRSINGQKRNFSKTKKGSSSAKTSETDEICICETCGKGFATSFELQKHIEYYFNENHKKCTFCEMEFQSSGTLHRHVSVHFHECHYECDICKARFKKERGLNAHKFMHENIGRAFACKTCNKKFQLKVGLKWHLRTKHSKNVDPTNMFFEHTEAHLGSHVDVMTSAALF